MMSWDYEPLSEEEAQKERFHLMADGVYRAVIDHCESKQSSSNNPMGVFFLKVWDVDGKPREIVDYIPFIRSMMWKFRHLCHSAGLVKEYEEKKFTPELAKGKTIWVNIKTQPGKEIPNEKLKNRAPGSRYPDKNVVDDYVVMDASDGKNSEFLDDSVPF